MKIALVGGILQFDPDYWSKIQPVPEINLLKGLRDRGHEVMPIGLRDWQEALRRSASADLVHVHHSGRATLALGLCRRNVPLVFTPHILPGPPDWRCRLANRIMLNKADTIVALSPNEARGYAVRARVVVIPNGLDPSYFSPVTRTAPRNGEPWRLLYVGQLAPHKQVDMLIRALAAPGLRGRCVLRLVHHTDGCESELRDLARRLGVADRVTFVGRKVGSELAREYQNAHIHLQVSLAEALPSVITEAMFTGLPVIASDVGGIRWQLDGWGRCLSRPTLESVVDAVLEITGDYAGHVSQGREVAADVRRRFSPEAMIDQHERLYANLVDRRSPVAGR